MKYTALWWWNIQDNVPAKGYASSSEVPPPHSRELFYLEIDLKIVIRLNRHLNLWPHQCLGATWTVAPWGRLFIMHHSQPSNDSKRFILTVPRSDHEESWLGVLPEGETLLELKATPHYGPSMLFITEEFLFTVKLISLMPFGIFPTTVALLTTVFVIVCVCMHRRMWVFVHHDAVLLWLQR